jgi:hypothetical protein
VAPTHIDNLTGVQPATINRTYVRRDVDPVFRSLPISAVMETTSRVGSSKSIGNFGADDRQPRGRSSRTEAGTQT